MSDQVQHHSTVTSNLLFRSETEVNTFVSRIVAIDELVLDHMNLK